MFDNRIRTALVVLAASAGLGACSSLGPYGGVGVGVGSGYGGYGSPYGYGYGSPYGYGYGSPYYGSYYNRYPSYGWYDGYYYPGAGRWVYDRYGRYYPINQRQSRYWRNMLEKVREARGDSAPAAQTENWSGFSAQGKVAAPVSAGVQADGRPVRQMVETRRQQRIERQQAQVERQQVRSESRSSSPRQIMRERAARRAAQPSSD